jgi:hypothetical protein
LEIELPLVLQIKSQDVTGPNEDRAAVKQDNYKETILTLNALMTAEEEHRSENNTYTALANLTYAPGKYRIPALSGKNTHSGYIYTDIWTPTTSSWGVCARPESYGITGDYTYVIDDRGQIFYTDNSGIEVTAWPKEWATPRQEVTGSIRRENHREKENTQPHDVPPYKRSPPHGYTGTWTTWYENGQKASEGEYVKGKPRGALTLWDQDGHKKQTMETLDEYRKRVIVWHPSGQKQMEMTYDETLSHITYYDEQGNVTRTEVWKDGEMVESR